MQFSKLAKYLQRLEDTPKRLEITSILAELINELEIEEIDKALYLSRGYLNAEFQTERFNIAEKMMIKILSAAFKSDEKIIKEKFAQTGDLGSVAFEINPQMKPSEISIKEAHEKLTLIATISGTGSQDKKIQKSAELISSTDKVSSKFLVRTILGTTRLGFTELTIVDALVQTINGAKDKKLKKQIESKYRIHPDIGLIAKKIKEKGIKGIEDVKMETGIPVHAQKPQRINSPVEIMEKMESAWLEYKFDGTRVQLHLDRNKKMETPEISQQGMFDTPKEVTFIRTYTRNLEETTHQFPDIIEAADLQIDAESAILDGEAIGYDKKTGEFLSFQETIQRKRKHGVGEVAKLIPLKYLVFDLLYLNGKSLVTETLEKRRKILDSIIKPGKTLEIDQHWVTKDANEVAALSKEALEKGLEGIMIKRPDSPYEAGARNFNWIKLKKSEEQILSDSVDCVVLGYYHGRGARAAFGIGGFLAGVWDEKENKFKTLTKVGTGLTDANWIKLKAMCDAIAAKEKPQNSEIEKKYDCDVWVRPEIVVELAADEMSKSKEHSVGYALRFPRLVKFRPDKKAIDTTSPKEIEQIYTNQ